MGAAGFKPLPARIPLQRCCRGKGQTIIKSIDDIQAQVAALAAKIGAPAHLLPRHDLTPDDDQEDFILIEGDDYVFIRTEPMGQFEHLRTNCADTLLYEVFKCLTHDMAEAASRPKYQPGIACRDFIWPEQTRLMGQLSPDWSKRLDMDRSRQPFGFREHAIVRRTPGPSNTPDTGERGSAGAGPAAATSTKRGVVTAAPRLLEPLVRKHDALLMRVQKLGPQEYSGEIERDYSGRFRGVPRLRFTGSAGNWGNKTLDDGERALVFITRQSDGRCYQGYWRAHFSMVERVGQWFVVAHWRLLEEGGGGWGPSYLREAAFLLDDDKPWQVFMPYDVFERHLLEELQRKEAAAGQAPG